MPKFLLLVLLSPFVVFFFTSQGASVVAGASEKKEKSDLAGSYDELIWHTTRGQALIHKQQWKAALIEWQYVCNAEPNDVLGLSNMAGCLAHTGDFNGVVGISSRLFVLVPNGFILKLRMDAYRCLHQNAKALADGKLLKKNGYTDEALRFIMSAQTQGGSDKIPQLQQEICPEPRCQDLQICLMTFLLQAGRKL